MVRKLTFYMAILASFLLMSSCGLNKGHSTGGGSSSIQITAPNNGEGFRTKKSDSILVSGICDRGVDVVLVTEPSRPVTNNCATDGTWSFETGTLSSGPNTFNIMDEARISNSGVTYNADLAVSFEIKARKTTIGVGEAVKLYVAIFDDKGAQIGIPEASAPHLFTWTSPDLGVATVVADSSPESGEIATVRGVAVTAPENPILIRVDLHDILSDYGYTGNSFNTIPITVTATPTLPPIPGIAVSMDIVAKNNIINVGETTKFYARFFDYKGSQIGITAPHTLSWESGDPLVASVPDPATGEYITVTGLDRGTATISVELVSIPGAYGYTGNASATKQIIVLSGGGTSNFTAFTNIGLLQSDDMLNAAAAQQADGKIVAVGATRNLGGMIIGDSTYKFAVARYNTDGTLDSTFGANGKIYTDVVPGPSVDDTATAIAIQPDGKIVVAGSTGENTSLFGGSSNRDFALVRYNSDGSLDDTFGTGGIVTTDVSRGGDDNATSVLIQPSGKIIVVGSSTVCRLGPRGGLGGGGSCSTDFAMVRYTSNGAIDTNEGCTENCPVDGFGGLGGIVTTSVGGDGSDNIAYSAIIQPEDGKIVVVGSTGNASCLMCVRSSTDFAVVRYNSEGIPDSNFGTNGIVVTDLGGGGIGIGGYDSASSVAIQPADGKIVVGGYTTTDSGSNDKSGFISIPQETIFLWIECLAVSV